MILSPFHPTVSNITIKTEFIAVPTHFFYTFLTLKKHTLRKVDSMFSYVQEE
jgi:hypothetical protein